MLAVTDPRVHTITVMCCTQLMKTELLNNIVGYFAHVDPSPMIVMQPTVKLAEAWSKDRLDKMIRDTPELSELFSPRKSRDASNTILHKEFSGGHVTVVGANAPSDLAMRPIRVVLCDEVDKYPASAGAEGDPIKLVAERTATFWNSLKVHVCSPTVEGRSRIQQEYEQSDMRVFKVPCLHCGAIEELEWKNVKWPENEPEKALYHCGPCGKPWEEHERLKAISEGFFEATAPFNGHAGFKVNKLASPWEPVAKLVRKFLDAKENPQTLKVFINTQLAETWKERGDAPEWERLYDRREEYKIGTVPEGVLFLTAGVDVQADRLECEVWGWGEDKQSWSIEVRVFEGDTARSDSKAWKELDAYMSETFEDARGNRFPISVMAVDSGYNTQTVYNWCRKYPFSRVIAVKGRDTQQVILTGGTVVDVRYGGQNRARGFRVFPIGVSVLKSELYGWLKLPSPIENETFPSGFVHFPEYGSDYFKQLTAEQLVTKKVRGYPKLYWEKIRERNEALDRRIYARAAASYFGLDRFKPHHWLRMKNEIEKKGAKTISKRPVPRQIKRRPSSWL